MYINKFDAISIRGRYIYAYLCLLNAIKRLKLEPLPDELQYVIHEFVSSNRLDIWHSKVDDILPSFLVDNDDKKIEVLSLEDVIKVNGYYIRQPVFLVDIIEDLFWLGINHLYCAYKSEDSLTYLRRIIETMNKENIPLPEFSEIQDFRIKKDDVWGENGDMYDYI